MFELDAGATFTDDPGLFPRGAPGVLQPQMCQESHFFFPNYRVNAFSSAGTDGVIVQRFVGNRVR